MTELPPVAGVYVAGGVTSVASIIGLISVFGIAVRNGILLISPIHHLQRSEGVTDLHQAVRRGAMERLAPILMTALAAGCALIPLALAPSEPVAAIALRNTLSDLLADSPPPRTRSSRNSCEAGSI